MALGVPARCRRREAITGVAVTSRSLKIVTCRTAAFGWLAAAVLSAAMPDIASSQTNQAPPAAASPAAAPPAGTANAQPSPPPDQASPAAPAQTPPSSDSALPPQPPPVAALPAPPAEKRGFLSEFGDWWKKSSDDFNAKMKEQQSKLDDFNKKSADAAKDAAAATQQAMKSALTPSKMVEMHEVCAIAGNGAADCATAATKACKAKGFETGQPLDVRTAEKCNASLWVSGQNPATADCPVETMLLRAACQ
jgi:hypothetical protein